MLLLLIPQEKNKENLLAIGFLRQQVEAINTTTCLIAPDLSSASAIFDDPTFDALLLWLGSGWTMHLLQLCLRISYAPVLFLSSLCSEEASKDHVLRHQS